MDKLTEIARIVDIWTSNNNDEEGDKFLSDAHLAMEAIDDVLQDISSGNRRMFMEAEA